MSLTFVGRGGGGSLIKINYLLLGKMRRMLQGSWTWVWRTGFGASFQRGVLLKMQDTLDQGSGRGWAAWGTDIRPHDAASPHQEAAGVVVVDSGGAAPVDTMQRRSGIWLQSWPSAVGVSLVSFLGGSITGAGSKDLARRGRLLAEHGVSLFSLGNGLTCDRDLT